MPLPIGCESRIGAHEFRSKAKSLVQSGFGIWVVSLASVAMAVVVCVIWLDRPIAVLAYEWFGRHRAVQHLAETPSFFGPLVVLAFAVLLVRWTLARRFTTIDVVANLCIITLAIGEPLKGWLKSGRPGQVRHDEIPGVAAFCCAEHGEAEGMADG